MALESLLPDRDSHKHLLTFLIYTLCFRRLWSHPPRTFVLCLYDYGQEPLQNPGCESHWHLKLDMSITVILIVSSNPKDFPFSVSQWCQLKALTLEKSQKDRALSTPSKIKPDSKQFTPRWSVKGTWLLIVSLFHYHS